MDFRQLESFVAIAKYKSFTRAAEELYLTQPTLTGHIPAISRPLKRNWARSSSTGRAGG